MRLWAVVALASCAGADNGVVRDTGAPSGDSGTDQGYTPCVDPVSALSELHAELRGASAAVVIQGLVGDDVYGCLAPCDGEDSCVEASCVGASTGAEIRYTQRWTEVTEGTTITRTGSTALVASGPVGAGWSRLELSDTFTTMEYTSADGGSETTRDISGAWVGGVAAHLPADASFTAQRTVAGDDCCWSEADTTIVADCETAYRHEAPVDGKAWTVHRAGQVARVRERANERFDGWLDGACVGEIDRDSGEVLGPCLEPGSDEI